ncbi:acyl carrier protein [bacterium]|nr:acyl carrier protein [bacterium]
MSNEMDSLALAELARALSRELMLEISPTMLFDHPTLDAVARFLYDESNVKTRHREIHAQQLKSKYHEENTVTILTFKF